MAVDDAPDAGSEHGPIAVDNPGGRGPFLIVCCHASSTIPQRLGGLGLTDADRQSHIAWDPGALEVGRSLARRLDAAVVYPCVSRLVIDVNRDPGAPDSIVAVSGGVPIPGNEGLDDAERTRRVDGVYAPYHERIEALVGERRAGRRPLILVAIHTFTPVLAGAERPWHVGVLHGEERSLADLLIEGFGANPGMVVGRNQPYGPEDRVYHTLEIHAESRGLQCAMIEIRSDQVAEPGAPDQWGATLATILTPAASAGVG